MVKRVRKQNGRRITFEIFSVIGNAPIYGLAATFPDRGTVKDLVAGYLDVLMELHDPK